MSRSSISNSSRRGSTTGGGSSSDTVGYLLAGIATALNDGLRIMHFADKRGWGPDEFEQVRALDEALDEAKVDFQAMAPLVNGQFFYESDRTPKSLDELRTLRSKFQAHSQLFKDWLRTGGPINPEWVLKTVELRRELHRAQCRAACRIYATGPGPNRCLGAFQVSRHQRQMEKQRSAGTAAEAESMLRVSGDPELGLSLEPQIITSPDGDERWRHENGFSGLNGMLEDGDGGRKLDGLEALVPVCNTVGKFERFGDRDIAFVCDYCDGFIVWEDLDKMPATRVPITKSSTQHSRPPTHSVTATAIPVTLLDRGQQEWQAKAYSMSSGEEMTTVFAPVAIANHLLPDIGDWRAPLLCPYCDEYTYVGGDDGDDDGETRYAQDERGFPDLKTFQEHLEWYHGGGVVPMPTAPTKKDNCIVM
ncbi:hypothetical protein PspLS_06684 [Pyricularia sp. CBS 133598]|nr:hypothetical protein PspLS_06684 [Pyricularia sp. CBS 133598]